MGVLFELHPTLIAFLLSQLSDRNTCFCAQITSVLLRLIVNLYVEVGKQDREAWLRTCIAPIVETVYSSREGRDHVFNYILPALLDIKPNFLSKELREEKGQRLACPSHSLFTLVITLEKELGLWGKDSSCYIGEGGKKLSESRALQYARSGSVEIELALMDLLSATSCVSAGFVARS